MSEIKLKLPVFDQLDVGMLYALNYDCKIVSTYDFSYQTKIKDRLETRYVRKDEDGTDYFVGYYSKLFPELNRNTGVKNFSEKTSILKFYNKSGFWLESHETKRCIPFEIYSEAGNIYDEYKVVKGFFKDENNPLSKMRAYLYILKY